MVYASHSRMTGSDVGDPSCFSSARKSPAWLDVIMTRYVSDVLQGRPSQVLRFSSPRTRKYRVDEHATVPSATIKAITRVAIGSGTMEVCSSNAARRPRTSARASHVARDDR